MFLPGNSVSGRGNSVSRQCGKKISDALKEQQSDLKPEQGEIARVGDNMSYVPWVTLVTMGRTWGFTLQRKGRQRNTWQESNMI